ATVLAIVKLGAIPVFADCDRYGLVDLEACRDLLKRNSAIRYFVPVHLYGHAMDLAELRNLRDEFDLKVVEDCAQSVGARSNGVPTGSAGPLAATRFSSTMTCVVLLLAWPFSDSPHVGVACCSVVCEYTR